MKPDSKRELAETVFKWIGIAVTLGGFVWGIASFQITARIQAETRQIEARKPFLERQLKLYIEATQAVSIIATSNSAAELEGAKKRFWQLYWGELAMVENSGIKGVEGAMVAFGKCLGKNCEKTELQRLSLKLAHACRDSLAASWGVADWSRKLNSPESD